MCFGSVNIADVPEYGCVYTASNFGSEGRATVGGTVCFFCLHHFGCTYNAIVFLAVAWMLSIVLSSSFSRGSVTGH